MRWLGIYGFYKHGRHRPIAAFDAPGPFALKGSFDQRWMNESMFDHIGIVARDLRASARLYAAATSKQAATSEIEDPLFDLHH